MEQTAESYPVHHGVDRGAECVELSASADRVVSGGAHSLSAAESSMSSPSASSNGPFTLSLHSLSGDVAGRALSKGAVVETVLGDSSTKSSGSLSDKVQVQHHQVMAAM